MEKDMEESLSAFQPKYRNQEIENFKKQKEEEDISELKKLLKKNSLKKNTTNFVISFLVSFSSYYVTNFLSNKIYKEIQ